MKLLASFHTPSRYLAGGVVCAALHNAIVIGLAVFRVSYPFALIVSFLITTLVGYYIHSAYTFETGRTWIRLWRFAGGAVSGFLISAALMVIFCSLLGMSVVIATPIATVMLLFWNFTAARWAILFDARS